ncbi:hypothetical protein JYT28_00130 [Desulfobulbus sp. AH-315-M07]|nr:hypothetical protein [Desulfobulbus sp. AH-315-M07]
MHRYFAYLACTAPLLLLACTVEGPVDSTDDDGSTNAAAATGSTTGEFVTASGAGGSNGAGGSGTAGVGGGTAAPTWDNFARTYLSGYCGSCHSPSGQASADFGVLSVVQQRLNAIRCGTAPVLLDNCEGEHPPGWFPIGSGPKPTEDERWEMVAWCEAGGPN